MSFPIIVLTFFKIPFPLYRPFHFLTYLISVRTIRVGGERPNSSGKVQVCDGPVLARGREVQAGCPQVCGGALFVTLFSVTWSTPRKAVSSQPRLSLYFIFLPPSAGSPRPWFFVLQRHGRARRRHLRGALRPRHARARGLEDQNAGERDLLLLPRAWCGGPASSRHLLFGFALKRENAMLAIQLLC